MIEQAKGVIREQNGIDVDAAFALLRAFSRDRDRRLIDVATEIVDRTLTASDLTKSAPDHHAPRPAPTDPQASARTRPGGRL